MKQHFIDVSTFRVNVLKLHLGKLKADDFQLLRICTQSTACGKWQVFSTKCIERCIERDWK